MLFLPLPHGSLEKKMGSQTEDECLVSLVSIFGPFFHFQDCWKNLPKTLKNYLYNPPKKTCLTDVYRFHDFSRGWKKSPCPIGNTSSTGPFFAMLVYPGLYQLQDQCFPLPPVWLLPTPPNRDGTTFDFSPPKNRCYKKTAGRWRSHGLTIPEGCLKGSNQFIINFSSCCSFGNETKKPFNLI